MHRRAALLVVGALALAACSSSDAATPPPSATVGDIGSLPPSVAPDSVTPTTDRPTTTRRPTTTSSPRRTTTDPSITDDSGSASSEPGGLDRERPVGSQIDGNRVIMIGDSVLASISNRYGNQLCTELMPRRWVVEVDAEVGRRIAFGRQVLAKRGDDDWDAAVIMLGNNYDGDAAAYTEELGLLLDELGPIPVVLVTVTRFRPSQDQVNYVLHAIEAQRDNVRLVDWQARTAEPDAKKLLGGDGLHLSETGRVALAAMITDALGTAPTGLEGDCLRSTFTDDSMGSVTGGTGSGSQTGSGTGSGSGSGSGSRLRFAVGVGLRRRRWRWRSRRATTHAATPTTHAPAPVNPTNPPVKPTNPPAPPATQPPSGGGGGDPVATPAP